MKNFTFKKYFIFLIFFILIIGSLSYTKEKETLTLSQDITLVDKSLTSTTGSEVLISNDSLLDYDAKYSLTITNNSSVKYTVVLFSDEFEKDAIYCEPNSSITITGKTSELLKDKSISVSSKDGSALDGYAFLKLIKN